VNGGNYDTRPPGEGTWSVFAAKVVEQRDAALERVAGLEAALRPFAAFPLPGGPGGDACYSEATARGFAAAEGKGWVDTAFAGVFDKAEDATVR
jgi:hypothetical protein